MAGSHKWYWSGLLIRQSEIWLTGSIPVPAANKGGLSSVVNSADCKSVTEGFGGSIPLPPTKQRGSRPTGRVMGLKIPKVRVRIPSSLPQKGGVGQLGRVVRFRPGMLKVRILPPLPKTEGTAEWSATGLENRGVVKHGRSIRLPSAKIKPEIKLPMSI